MANTVHPTAAMVVVSLDPPHWESPDRLCDSFYYDAFKEATTDFVQQPEGGVLWVGWPRCAGSPKPKDRVVPPQVKEEDRLLFRKACFFLFRPVMHSMLENPSTYIFDEAAWEGYRKVNLKFAEAAIEAIQKLNQEGSTKAGGSIAVWIHDYQFMLAASPIREVMELEEQVSGKIGFSLYAPFPSWHNVRMLPWLDSILQGLLACDTISFQSKEHASNFVDCCHRGLGSRVDRRSMLVEHGGRTVQVRVLPAGVPFNLLEGLAKSSMPGGAAVQTGSKGGQQTVFSVDRLRTSGGLLLRLLAFQRLLEDHPDLLEKVTLVLATEGSGEPYGCEEMDEVVMAVLRIKRKFSTSTWCPVQCFLGLQGQYLADYYRKADVVLATRVCDDSLALEAREFVACQVEERGVLVLSALAGSSEAMPEALLVNPYNIKETATEGLYRALTMPEDERRMRMTNLRDRERRNDLGKTDWIRRFWEGLLIGSRTSPDGDCGSPSSSPVRMGPVTVQDFDDMMLAFDDHLGPLQQQQQVRGQPPRLLTLLLDYDGTLAPICKHPDLATLPPETKVLLEKLAARPDVFVAVVSGRGVDNVKSMVGIEGVTYAGNHGMEILHRDGSKFLHPLPPDHQARLQTLKAELTAQKCHDGAWIEDKGVILTFHYRNVPDEKRSTLVAEVKQMIDEAGFKIGLAHCAIEIRPPQVKWDKGRASLYILQTVFGMEWPQRTKVIFVGDDVTDEDAIKALKGMAFTFRIVANGTPPVATLADQRLPSTDSVVTLLKWVDQRFPGNRN